MITVYGADWCEDTRRSQRLLRRLHVPHRYVNIDDDLDGLERAKALNHGQRRTPTIDLGLGGEALVEPDNDTLAAALVEREMLTLERGPRTPRDPERRRHRAGGADHARRGAAGAGAAAAPRPLRWPLRLAGVFAAATGICRLVSRRIRPPASPRSAVPAIVRTKRNVPPGSPRRAGAAAASGEGTDA